MKGFRLGKDGHEFVGCTKTTPTELVVIDNRVLDFDGTLSCFRPDIPVYVIHEYDDAIDMLSRALQSFHALKTIHLISHAQPGKMQLGSSGLDLATVLARSDEIAAWQQSLANDAEVLIYGCNLAKNDAGQALVGALAEFTGTTVAASNTPTGSAALGGDWILQFTTGHIQSDLAFSANGKAQWQGVLEDKFGEEEPVHTYKPGDQFQPSIAALAGGGWVVVWTSVDQDGSSWGVYAQRFDANGVAVDSEFQVNTTTASSQYEPTVTALDGGGFVVAWRDNSGADGSGDGIFSQLYDASANPVGGETQVNTYTSSTQGWPNIEALSDGGYIVTWSSWSQDGSNYGVFAQRYDASGAAVGSEFQVNTITSGYQTESDATVLADGTIVIAWEDQSGADGSGYGVYFRRFDTDGTPLDVADVQANVTTSSHQQDVSIAALSGGSYVVVWQSSGQDGSGYGVYARLFNADGSAASGEILVNETTSSDQSDPQVVGLTGGGFAVAWYSASSADVYVREFSDTGVPSTGEQRVNTYTTSTQYEPTLAALPDGNYVVAWRSNNQDPDNSDGVFQQIFGAASEFDRQANPTIEDVVSSVTFDENTVNAAPQVIDALAAVGDIDSADFDGGQLLVTYVQGVQTGSAEDQLTINSQGSGADQVELIGSSVRYEGVEIGVVDGTDNGQDGAALRISFNANASVEAVESVLQNLAYGNSSHSPDTERTISIRLSDGDGGTSQPSTVEINVTPEYDGTPALFEEEQVNVYTPSTQHQPAVAALSGGGHVVVWSSYNQDAGVNTYGVFGQRYDADGVAVGEEFQINSTETASQEQPRVAGLDDGSFVVVWTDSSGADGSGWGVFGQRYAADGSVLGSEFQVNTYAPSTQWQPDVAAVTGGFVATWSSNGQDGSSYGVYGQRFNNDGTTSGGEFQVSTTTANSQEASAVVSLTGGGFIAVWADNSGTDGSGWGIFGQRYAADGSAVGGEFQVNSTTSGTQYLPAIAQLADGGFLVVWQDQSNNDGNGYGIYAQRYDASGNAVGSEFLVNETTSGHQQQPQAIGLANGGFVIAWYGQSADVYLREYAADGTVVDGEHRVNAEISGTESEPVLAHLGSDNYVVAWTDSNQDGSSQGIFQRIFGDETEFTRQQDPVITGFTDTVSFAENTVNAAPQPIDLSVSLFDADSPDFDGGSLIVSYLKDGSADDQLGVQNQGAGSGQIGVSGSNISFSGTVIGSIDSTDDGQDGAVLRISLNSNASVEAVEALLQNVTYANNSNTPELDRTLEVRLWDGDGGASEAQQVLVTVTREDEANSTPALFEEEQVNTYTPNSQNQPAVAALSGGGHVVVWSSWNQDQGSTYGVFGQRYDTNGVAVGEEFQINTTMASTQDKPRVAGLDDGGFVVVWQDHSGADGNGWGVFGQRYAADGSALGSEFQINTHAVSTQHEPDVAAVSGGFVVTWSSFNQDVGLSDYGVFAQRYNNDGSVNGAEFQINTTTANQQEASAVVSLTGGGFVTVWADASGADSDGWGIFGQRFASDGSVVGSEFQVNTTVNGNQSGPAVAQLADGGFLVVWEDQSGNDGANFGVFAQRFDSSGTAVGSEFIVNETISGNQYQPQAIGLANGGFVIAWFGQNNDVYLREYAADGTAVDGEHRVNEDTSGAEYEPTLAHLGNNNFVVVWRDSNQDGSSDGIFQRIFGDETDFTRQQNPVLDDLTGQADFLDTDIGAAPQFLDTDVDVIDPDSADFNGGEFLVHYLAGSNANDALAINNEGTGAGEIGVSGSSVTYGGTTIGTVDSTDDGASGGDLRIALNASATPEALTALLENLRYQNTVDGAGTNRYLGLRLSDGDGGVSEAQDMTVRILSSVSPPTIAINDWETSHNFTETQAQSPQIFDAAQQFEYNGASGFDGGYLWLVQSTGTTSADNFAVNDQGTGAGQIGVSGTDISYGGTVIGTIDGTHDGVDGNNLRIDFNANANAEAIEALLENLTYYTTSDGPAASRTFYYYVYDASNTWSGTNNITINIEPELDGASFLFDETQVNSYMDGHQEQPRVTELNDGGYLVVWQSEGGQDGDSWGIYAQRYDANGVAVAPEFLVNTTTQGQQGMPVAAGLDDGSYVVAWRDYTLGDGNADGIFAQRFNADNSPAGGEFLVNTTTASNQIQPAVAAVTGGFVVAWTDDSGADGSAHGVFAQRYQNDGTALGSEFQVNSFVTSTQWEPSVASLNGGGFVVTWSSYNQDAGVTDYGVFGQLYDAAGATVGSEFQINTNTAHNQSAPDAVGLSGGGFVVVWPSNHDGWGVHGQRYDASGNPVGSEFRIDTPETSAGSYPVEVAALGSGGFVASWTNGSTIYAQQFDASGNKVDGPTQINSTTFSTQFQPDIAGISGDNVVVVWSSYGQEADGSANTYGVFSQILGTPGSLTQQLAPAIADLSQVVTLSEDDVNAAPQLIDPSMQLTDLDSADFDGGRLWMHRLTGYGEANQPFYAGINEQDQLGINNEGNQAGQIGVTGSNVSYGGTVIGTIVSDGSDGSDLIIDFNANATPVAVEQLLQNLTYANASDDPQLSRTFSIQIMDGDGGTSAPGVVRVDVTPNVDGAVAINGEQQVNTFEVGHQQTPAIAALSGGGHVVVWASAGQDGWSDGVYGQRYNAEGVPVGTEFKISDYTPNDQQVPDVIGLAGGGFAVVWQSSGQDGSSWGIYGQRFDADGFAVGSEFQVNDTILSAQTNAAIAALNDGGFVVTWTDQGGLDGSSYGVFGQRFDSGGNPVGATEFQVNTFTTNVQYQSSVVGMTDGDFMVVWSSYNQDAGVSDYGVFAQRYDASGATVGSEFQINTFTANHQDLPTVAALVDGGFLVAWESSVQDGSSEGIYAQRYDSSGNTVGDEFRVTASTSGSQNQPQAVGLEDGGFVVAWAQDSNDVYFQQYNAAGERVDAETRANETSVSTVFQPTLTALENSNFAMAWTAWSVETGGSGSYGVFSRVFGDSADFVAQASPELEGVDPVVVFDENDINVVPGVIDGAVVLQDVDSANFDGGSLTINYLTAYGDRDALGMDIGSQDQLWIRDQGTAENQIGVSGTDISYGGTLIGSVVSNGQNGASLVVNFNANATPEAVEALIQNVTYSNTSDNPADSRTIVFNVTDGDGGSTGSRPVEIQVNAQVDGVVPFFTGEQVVNTEVTNNQQEPAVAGLTDGGYVIVWQANAHPTDSGWGIYGQRYDADGNAVGGEFHVNTTTASNQQVPQVAGLDDGSFVVVWQDNSGADGNGLGVFGQRYAADGTALGGEFQINTHAVSTQYEPDVAVENGGFVVTWSSFNQDLGLSDYGVFAQRFNNDGSLNGAEFQINTTTASHQQNSAVISLAGGGFVTVWEDVSGADGDAYGVFGQRFAADGTTLGSEFQVNTYSASNQRYPEISALTDGGFIVAWQSSSQDLSSEGIYAQRYDASGNAVGTEFRVNSTTSGSQADVTVAGLDNGGFVIGWTHGGDSYFQQYDSVGRQIDAETQVNSFDNNNQISPALAAVPDGFVMAWQSWNQPVNTDGSGNSTYEIVAQRFINNAPGLSPVSVSVDEDTAVVLTDELFEGGFNDPQGDPLQAIRIVTLPPNGTLTLDGVAVTPGQEIGVVDLEADRLEFLGDQDFFGITQFSWTASDGAVFSDDVVITSITVNPVNDAPALDVGNDDTGVEGPGLFSHTITLGDPDPDTYQITVDWGDGSPNTVFTTPDKTPTITHDYTDDGAYTVNVTVNDQAGQPNSEESGSFQVTIDNFLPTISLLGDNDVEQNQVYTLTLNSVFDWGDDTVSQYIVDWGDGSPTETFVALGGVTHTYTTVDTYNISVDLVDEDGTHQDAGSKTVQVSAPAESVVIDTVTDATVAEGSLFQQTISFSDPTDQNTDGWDYEIDWGDGSTNTTGVSFDRDFVISHVFADGVDSHTVSVTVSDRSSSPLQTDTITFDVDVTNVAPTLGLVGPGSVNEADTYTLTLASLSDPGDDTATSYVIDWGDGSSTDTVNALGDVTHVFADGSDSHTITVTVTDEDGSYDFTKVVSVNNVAPTIALSGDDSVDEGSTYTLTLGAVTDPGDDTVTTYRVNWGDGNTEDFASAGDVTHVYADGDSTPTISVTLIDEDGTHTNAGSKAITVNNVAPTIALGGDDSVDEGATYTLTLGAVTDPGDDTVTTYRVDWGDGNTEDFASAGDVTHVYADGDSTPTINVTLIDEDGTHVNAGSKTITVNDVAPTIALSGDDSVDEGSTYTLTLGVVTDPGDDTVTTYRVDWGDGNTEDFASAGDVTHVYADGISTPTISVTLIDEDGTHANAGSKTITVNNVVPDIALSGASDVDEGAPYILTLGAVTDPGDDTVTTYRVDWGDGNTEDFASAGDVTHTYSTANNYTINVTLIDEDGTHTNVESLPVTVNVPPAGVSVNAGGDGNVDEGGVFSRTITFSDDLDTGGDGWTYDIDWGDGATESGSTTNTSIDISHLYNDGDASYPVTVTVTDTVGDSDSKTFNVSVNNVAPTIALSGDDSVDEGSTYTLTLGAVTDPGDDTVTTYRVDWGDGNTEDFASAGDVTHVYADGDSAPTISVSLIDGDGTHADAGSKTITVNNVAPTIALIGDDSVDEGATYTLTLGAVTDPGDDTVTTYRVDWGDGNTEDFASAGDVTHVYADGVSTPTINVSLIDEDGTHVNAGSKTITVNDVAPTIVLSGDDNVNEGSTYTLTLGAVTDPGDDTVTTYRVDWGDGNTEDFASAGDVTHVYADGDSTPTISVTLIDEDGTHANAGSKTITVNNVIPDIALSGASDVDEGALYTLNLGAVTDPGDDTVTTYRVNWGDGNTEDFASAGDVTHTYSTAGNYTINVTLIDEDGTHADVESLPVTVNPPAAGVSVNAGGDGSVDEGSVFNRTITFTDDEDADGNGWTYDIDWGDGTTENGSTTNTSIDISHLYDDGDASYPVTVTVTDTVGDSDSKTFNVAVNNVAPTIALSGDASVDEGSTYTLTLGAVTDPGDDTVTSYIVNWGDGSLPEIVATAGDVTHVYADGDSVMNISVTLVDEDGFHVAAGTHSVTVNNVAPLLTLDGNNSVEEGSVYTLTLASLLDPGDDTVSSYVVDWGDGSTTETVGSLGDVTHVFADGFASHTITVTVTDEDGSYDFTKAVTVNNVAPTIALAGAISVDEGETYALTLGSINDPGDDVVTEYIVDWGDGTSDTYNAGGDVTHVYATDGNYTISVSLQDEDGLHADAGELMVIVNDVSVETVRIGDAPIRVSRSNPDAWADAWTDDGVAISHKADYGDASESWSDVTLNARSSHLLEGGDVFGGDLGVSGQALNSSSIRQEIDGTEALQFDFDGVATAVDVELSRLNVDTDNGHYDAGRLELFNEAGDLVHEELFFADELSHEQQIRVEHTEGFGSVVLTAGVYDGSVFHFGGIADSSGGYLSDPVDLSDGSWDGSDYLLNAIEFEFGPVSAPGPGILALSVSGDGNGATGEEGTLTLGDEAPLIGLIDDTDTV